MRNYNKRKPDGSSLNTKKGKKRIGFIADELEEVFPGLVQERKKSYHGTEFSDFKSIRMGTLVPILVKAVQELSAKVTALESA